MKPLLLTVGNIYVDHNVFGVNAGAQYKLESGEDYLATSGERVLGGSAVNAAMQAHRLGIEVGFIGKTGSDSGGEEVRALLGEQGVISELVEEDDSHATSMAINLVDKHGEFIGVHYGEASKTLAAENIDMEHELLERCNAVYFGGTAKQPILFKDCDKVFSKLSNRGIKVFYDPNRFPAKEVSVDRSLLQVQLASVDGYFPNEKELVQATGKPDIDKALEQVLESGVTFVALKLGAMGCRVKTQQDDFTVAGKPVQARSTVGAGDCFNATFIAYYLKGLSLKECAERAIVAAAIKVSENRWPDEVVISKALQKRF